MLPSKLFLVSTLLCLGSVPALAQSDSAAARVLGQQWKQMSRAAGMVFSGTVLDVASPVATESLPTIQVRVKVDRAIAGVRDGQILTIREWTGAWERHRPIRAGEHLLLLLYPLSRLGLTSPVNGAQGQVALDSKGQMRADPSVSIRDLERAIRSVRSR